MPHFLELKLTNLLHKCSFKQLKQIHAFIVTTSLDGNIQILSKFLRRSTEFGEMEYPNLIFSQMGGIFCSDITLWNAMIRGYAYNGPFQNCISMYDEMPQRGLKPNNFTYPYVLNSCSELGWYIKGIKVHCQVFKTGFDNVFSVGNSLFNMYVRMADSFEVGVLKRGKFDDARKVFDDMCFKPVELWNRMISEYVGIGDVDCSRQLFDDMSERDVVSWNSMISGYVRVGDVRNARDLFERMPEKNVISWTSMIGAYSGCGDLETARAFFEKMPYRNLVSWNSMISSYTRNRKFEEALDLFVQMQLERVDPDGFTFVSALSACSHLGALEFGRWVHCLIKDWPKLAVIVGTALIEMYAKCGDANKAFTIFIKIGNKDVFCFNVMIRSLAIHGRIEDAIKIFFLMQKRGLKPNDFTLTSALFACSHGGLLEEGRKIFYNMEKHFGISPKLEHFGCMIDLLSRNCQLEEAQALVKEMPFEPDIAIWGALLGGCRVSSDLKLAKRVIEIAGKLNTDESGVYVLWSNMYASVGQWQEASSAREKMEEKNIWKRTGCSSVIHDSCGSDQVEGEP
ncbi:pentatricopeptide repeat-containing protein At3g29230-like [Cornus florida]|uniref:pentatricopeptide repeat-containing protein At3g29230-like n=1 Tax=Cornus florida TaxID=4283 RepID=UPI00289C56A7|nr:pentatricopeptide repeat-containing protein At3g29230-like [Cornus florida]